MSSTIVPDRPRTHQQIPEVVFEEAPSDAAPEYWEEAEPTFWDKVKEAPAWAISLAVHLGLLALLGTFTKAVDLLTTEDIVSLPIEEVQPETFKFETTVQDVIGNDSNLDKPSPSQQLSLAQGQTPAEEATQRLQEEFNVEAPTYEQAVAVQKSDLTAHYEARGATEHTGGTDGAMDRIAFEIETALRNNKVLVTWMFDASLSVQERRNSVAERFENIYKQVGLRGLGEGDTLLTSAVYFGATTTFMIDEPTSDITELTEKIRNIPADETGKEMVFTGIEQVVAKWGKHRTKDRRDMMIVIVTDERGDDFDKMESVIRNLSRMGVRVYCIGNAAVFGKEKGYVTFTWQEGNETFTDDLPVDQGPETFYPELLDIDFWGLTNKDAYNRLSSSYGPYPLNRLTTETGGLYLVVEESARSVKYNYEVMRNYQPDYRPINELDREIATNKAKTALTQASNLMRIDRLTLPVLLFDAESDNTLRAEILEAQKPVAVLDYKIDQVLALLESGSKDRDKLVSPRWRAAYDLAMGRALALKVRLFGYSMMLAEMRTGLKPFENPNSNAWVLEPSHDMKNATPAVRKMAKQAEEHLQRVMNEHAGTPWSTLAEAEYSQAMGWSWREVARPRANAAMRNANDPDAARLLLAEEERRRQMQQRPQPKKKPIL